MTKKVYVLPHRLYGWIFECWKHQQEKTKKCKIKPKYPGVTPGHISLFLPGKIRPKRPIFYHITCMGQFLYTGKNIKQELRNAKYI